VFSNVYHNTRLTLLVTWKMATNCVGFWKKWMEVGAILTEHCFSWQIYQPVWRVNCFIRRPRL